MSRWDYATPVGNVRVWARQALGFYVQHYQTKMLLFVQESKLRKRVAVHFGNSPESSLVTKQHSLRQFVLLIEECSQECMC